MTFKEARYKAGLTISEASRRIGVSPSTISRWEDGINNPIAFRLPKIAEVYGCDLQELIDIVFKRVGGKRIANAT